jgi:APA family basic amino acid/polyamine antiporter
LSAQPRSRRLRRELTLPYAFALATGVTMSSGLFLLPGLAFATAGPAIVLAYLIAALPLIPGVLSKAELATAMPRAGGDYFFADRSMGPLPGTVAGFGTWFALVLKSAFALVGMGAYAALLLPSFPFQYVAAGFAALLGVLNWLGVRRTGAFQAVLIVVLLGVLAWFSVTGGLHVDIGHFRGFFAAGNDAILATAAMVCVAYVGITNIASVSEEIHRPERTIPLAMFLALVTAMVLFAVGTFVMVGVLPADQLSGSLTPVADAAGVLWGRWGGLFLTVAALFAFVSVANAGILSASRYPLAMARDHLIPRAFRYVGNHHTPTVAIIVTVAAILLCVLIFNPTRIAKLASAFQLLLFSSNCLGVLVMRESRIASYDPGYRSPLYPWLHIVGVVVPLWFIAQMGALAVLFCVGLALVGVAWYFQYGRARVARSGAVHHVFERWGRRRDHGLDPELREIMKEKGLREEDPFDEVVARAAVLDLGRFLGFEEVVAEASAALARRLPLSQADLVAGFLAGTRVGATPVAHGAALPHLRAPLVQRPEAVLVRTSAGLTVAHDPALWGEHQPSEPIYALFFLVSPEDDPTQHLRLLAHIASRVDDEEFLAQWLEAENGHEMKEILLREERYLHLSLQEDARSQALIGKRLRDLPLPKGCLIAIVHRGEEAIVPDGDTELLTGDRITVIGNPRGIRLVASRYGERDEVLLPSQ